MAKKQTLQEIYGENENDDEVEVAQEEIGSALTEMIAELKAKYGDEWTKHIGEASE
jgi:mannose/fructose-specific phosphotransferase system component IIA